MELEYVTKSAPVAKIVSVIIRHAVEGGASDIHVEPLLKESRVRYRIDGILHTSLVNGISSFFDPSLSFTNSFSPKVSNNISGLSD